MKLETLPATVTKLCASELTGTITEMINFAVLSKSSPDDMK